MKIDGEVSIESGIGTLSISSTQGSETNVGIPDRPMLSSSSAVVSDTESGMLVPVSDESGLTSEGGSLVVVACPPAVPTSLSESSKF